MGGRHDFIDLSMMSVSDMGASSLRLLSEMGKSSEQYPEMIFRTTAIKMGFLGESLWNLTKNLLPKQTREKFMPTDCDSLSDISSSDNLPRQFGGVCNCELC